MKRSLCAAGSGLFSVFIARYGEQRALFSFLLPVFNLYYPPVYKQSLLARIIGKKCENRACVTKKLFNLIHLFCVRKHSTKAISSGFFMEI